MLDLDSGGKSQSKISKSGGCYLLTGNGCKMQPGHNGVAATEFSSPCYFIANGPELGKLYMYKDPHYYGFYPMQGKKQLASNLKLEPNDLPSFSVFMGHGYLQHEHADYFGCYSINYHVYLMPETIPTLSAICYSYGKSFAVLTKVVAAVTEYGRYEEIVGGISIKSN